MLSPSKDRDYRRVFGFFFCDYCQLQWESPDTYQTTNLRYVDAQDCPVCAYPALPFETQRICVFCDGFPCKCCRECKEFPCACCVRCFRTPCACCKRCGRLQCLAECCAECDRCPCRCLCTGCRHFMRECTCEVRVYGYYRCSNCGKTWESAYTFVRGGGKTGLKGKFAHVAHGQQCKGCDNEDFHLAVKWDRIVCQKCLVKPCVCKGKRHINHDKNHMQDLCERCKNKENPCSSYRFVDVAHLSKEEQEEEVRLAEERGREMQTAEDAAAVTVSTAPPTAPTAPTAHLAPLTTMLGLLPLPHPPPLL